MTHRRTNPKVFNNATELRHALTDPEARLWDVLRMHRVENVHFRRQHAIGPYIVDFCAPREKLVIELDGSQHIEQQEYVLEPTTFLTEKGYRVLRFWNNEVMKNPERVVKMVLDALKG